VASSYGQGSIQFNTYAANNSTSVLTVYGNGTQVGATVPNTFTGELLYSLTPINDSASTSQAPLTAGWTVGSTGTFGDTFVPGTVFGPNLVLPSYSSGQVYFEFAAFSGSSYASSTYSGHSASFSQAMATGLATAWVADGNPGALSGSGSGFLPGSFSVFTAVPEPTTLALAGLGGLASLVALRRKQA